MVFSEPSEPTVAFGSQLSWQIHPEGPPTNLNGKGKQFVMGYNPGDGCVYIFGGDYKNDFESLYTGVAPGETNDQDGMQFIWKLDFSGEKMVMTCVQPYWPQYDETGGWLMWNLDDGGGTWVQANGVWEYWCFRSTGVITSSGEPIIGRFNYPGSGDDPDLVGNLVNTADDHYIGAWNPLTGHWRRAAARPSELGSNKCQYGVFDPTSGIVFWNCSETKLIGIDADTGTEVTPRHTGTLSCAALNGDSYLNLPETCRWQTAGCFIAECPDAGYGRSVFVADTSGNGRCLAISISRYQSWNQGSETFTAGFPALKCSNFPATFAAIGTQGNPSFTYDVATATACFWDTTQPGYLYTCPIADILDSGSWVTQTRADFKIENDNSARRFGQRLNYLNNLQKTLCFGYITFAEVGGFDANIENFDPVLIDLRDGPSWLPPRGEVAAVMGGGVTGNTDTLSTRLPGVGDWNWQGNGANRFTAYSSFVYNPYGPGKYGCFYAAYVGGDTDWAGPDGYRCEIGDSAPTWARFIEPYDVPGITVITTTPASSVISTTNDVTLSEYLTKSGVTPSPHSYGMQVVADPMPNRPNGSLVHPILRFCWGTTGTTHVAHQVDCSVASGTNAAETVISRAANSANTGFAAEGTACWDHVNRRILLAPTGVSEQDVDIWRVWSDPDDDNVFQTVSTITLNCPQNSIRSDPTLKFWTTAEVASGVRTQRNFCVMFGIARTTFEFAIQLYDPELTGGAQAQWEPTLNYVGASRDIPASTGPGVAYVPRHRAFYVRLGGVEDISDYSGYENTIWKITPPPFGTGNPRTDAWDVEEITMAGDTVTCLLTTGLWNGFAYNEKLHSLMWQDLAGGNLWFYPFDD